MPFPKPNTSIARPDLGFAVQEYIESAPAMGFIGLEVMPIFATPYQATTFPVIPKEALLGLGDTKRAMRGFYNRGDWEFEQGKYSTSEHGWEEPVDDRERNLYKASIDADTIAVQRATAMILRSQEKRIADKVFNATNFTAHGVTNEWDDAAAGVPLDDLETGKLAVRSACGMMPNTLIIAYSTFLNLRRNAQLKAQFGSAFAGQDANNMTVQQMAHLLDVEKLLVGGAVYNSAKKGQSAVIANLWDKEYAMLTITSAAADISEPCIGRTFLWTEESADNTVVEQYRAESNRSDIFRVRHDTDERLLRSVDDDDTTVSDIAAAVSYLFGNITT
jgi:hypothetical protein